MNEIDFTLAPTDVSLSRCYQMSKANNNPSSASTAAESQTAAQSVQSLSLTRALNTASNRAVRRILLARSWPSAEALNLSLRTVLMQQKEKDEVAKAGVTQQQEQQEGGEVGEDRDKMKCPVPRPILNILTRRDGSGSSEEGSTDELSPPATTASSEEREQKWIQNQIAVFRDSYSSIPGYDQAEAYLESILFLATSGEESARAAEVMEGGVYVEPYARVLSVIQSVGAVLEYAGDTSRRRIAKKLIDQDICLSMLDKIALANERNAAATSASSSAEAEKKASPVAIPYDAAARLAWEADVINSSTSFEDYKAKYQAEIVAMVTAKKRRRDEEDAQLKQSSEALKEEEPKGAYEKGRRQRLASFLRRSIRGGVRQGEVEAVTIEVEATESSHAEDTESVPSEPSIVIKPDDLGGVLLSAEEPTMTRQLNVLSNIVQRSLIFGGDQELLVLAETLDADKPAFIQRWYKDDSSDNSDILSETRPGVQYLNSLIQLLRDCYTKGVLKEITPTLPLPTGYQNAYGRLTASLIELGSGYVRPSSSSSLALAMTPSTATAKYLTSTAPPKTAREELGRFAQWESAVRKNRENPYPDE